MDSSEASKRNKGGAGSYWWKANRLATETRLMTVERLDAGALGTDAILASLDPEHMGWPGGPTVVVLHFDDAPLTQALVARLARCGWAPGSPRPDVAGELARRLLTPRR